MPFDGRFWGQSVDVKVVIFGLAISSSWGNGHATPWRGPLLGVDHPRAPGRVLRAGYGVVRGPSRSAPFARWPACPLQRLGRRPAGGAASLLADADAGIVTSYCPDALVASALLMRSTVAVRAFYDLDTPVTLANLAAGQGVPYVGTRGLGDYDLVLSYTGGAALDGLCQQLGARRVAPLYGSVNPAVHHEVDPAPAYRCDLSYLGTFAADRQAAVEELFVAPARQLPECRFVLGGSGYPASFPGRRTSTSCGTCRPPSIPPFTARAA